MSDRLSEIEARLQQLEAAIRDLQRGDMPARWGETGPATGPSAAGLLSFHPDVVTWLTLTGRTLMVLGGAYLLRALTESGRLPASSGLLIGVGYALAWFGAADWAGATRGRKLSGVFHGLTAVLIGLPLLLEASTRFGFLSSEGSAVALAGLTLLALAVAWHRSLQSLAGIAILGSIAATVVLAARTGTLEPFTGALLAMGAAAMWLAETRGWAWLRWPPAIAVNLMVLLLIVRAPARPPGAGLWSLVILQGLLVVTYVVPAVWRTLIRRLPAQTFDVLQTALAIGLGLGGAWMIVHDRAPFAGLLIGGLVATSALGGYAAAFGIIARSQGRGPTFVAYLTFGVALAIAGAAAFLADGALAICLSACAVASAVFGARYGQPMLSLHAALFAVAAALASGLVRATTAVWVTAEPWPPFSFTQGIVILATAACVVVPWSRSPGQIAASPWWWRAAELILATVVVCAGGALVVRVLGPLLGGRPVSAGVLASVRTVTLAALALVTPLAGRWSAPFRWLVYPLLFAGSIKLLVDDFPHSDPVTLFPALAMYGAALILAPRLARRTRG